jgi:predicted nucleic acid-binding protein
MSTIVAANSVQPIPGRGASLAQIRELIATAKLLRDTIGNVIQLRVVLDTNAIFHDLIWLCKKRSNRQAMTSIQELIESQTLIPYAPYHVRREIEKHIADIAKKQKLTERELRDAWGSYQKALTFCNIKVQPTEINKNVRDPNDLPFIKLADQIGASGIVTRDKDIQAMGGNPICLDCIIELRDYARAKHIELSFRLGTVLFVSVSFAALWGVIKIIKGMISVVSNLPTWTKVILILGAIFLIAHRPAREAVGKRLTSVGKKIRGGIRTTKEPLAELAQKAVSAQQIASDALAKVERRLPSANRKAPLTTAAYAICLAAGSPLSLLELERKLLAAGYRSKSKNLSSYLCRCLEADERFYKHEDGNWVVRERE